jgi:hypothetical protein
MGFLGGFLNKARALGSKALGTVTTVGSKLGNIAGKVGELATRVAPTLGAINPQLGGIASAVGRGAYQAGGIAHAVALGASKLRDRLNPGQAPPVGAAANQLD